MESADSKTTCESAEIINCIIKQEFVLSDHVRSLTVKCVSGTDKEKLKENDGEPNGVGDSESAESKKRGDEGEFSTNKRRRLDHKKDKKLKGQNKNRGVTFRVERENEFCPHILDSPDGSDEKSCPTQNCVFIHDFRAYLEKKPKDVGETCYIYSTRGHCPRGITCRFGSKHLTEDGRNLRNSELLEKWEADPSNQTFQSLSKELQAELRKKRYDFRKSEEAVKHVDRLSGRIPAKKAGEEEEAGKHSGPVEDTDVIKLRNGEKKQIDWADKLYLSPLTTVGNLPFRRVCKEWGADVTCGEMAMAQSLLQGMPQEWALVKRHASENLFGVQICGGNMPMMTRCAQVLQENAEVDFIDINLGCPLDFIYEQGCGSGLLRRERILGTIVKALTTLLDVPLTIKTRTGISTGKNIAHNLMPLFRDSGVSLITVHGRSREQRYIRSADWDYIEQCASLAAPTPLFGNGDILSYVDYENSRAKAPSAKGVMIGRGALIKPWIFTEIKERRHIDISSGERFEMLQKYVNYGLEHWGSDTRGVETTRRFLLEWLSFLYRYIPVGLLVSPPQTINERPPFYKGRDELETLMASGNCADWIKISEMLLGPVPEGFNFLPKHKANAWT